MSTHHLVTRRVVLIGGVSVVLVGCEPPTAGGGGGDGSSDPQSSAPDWAARLPMYLTMYAIGAPFAGALLGRLGLTMLPAILARTGPWAGQASRWVEAILSKNELRLDRFAVPAANAAPRPFIASGSGEINDFDFVPVVRNNVALQLAIQNEEGGNFGEHDIYATIRRVDDPPPRTYSDIFGSAHLPHVIVSPAPDGNWDQRIDMGALPPGAYVSYSWRVPRGRQPSDDYIASTGFIGPAFLSVDDASYSVDLAGAMDDGNVEARFQLPDVSLV